MNKKKATQRRKQAVKRTKQGIKKELKKHKQNKGTKLMSTKLGEPQSDFQNCWSQKRQKAKRSFLHDFSFQLKNLLLQNNFTLYSGPYIQLLDTCRHFSIHYRVNLGLVIPNK